MNTLDLTDYFSNIPLPILEIKYNYSRITQILGGKIMGKYNLTSFKINYIGIILFLIGFVLLFFEDSIINSTIFKETLFPRILGEIIPSLFISGFLAITIENIYQKENREMIFTAIEQFQLTEFKKSLSDKVSNEICETIYKSILNPPYIIRDMDISLDFQNSDEGYLSIKDTTSFTIVNLSDSDYRFDIPADEDNELFSKYPEYPKLIECKLDGKEIAKKNIIKENGHLSIQFIGILPPRGSIKVKFSIIKQVLVDDSDMWNVTAKTANFVLMHNNLKNVKIKVVYHTTDVKEWDTKVNQGSASYKYFGGLLPYQGLRLSWRSHNE